MPLDANQPSNPPEPRDDVTQFDADAAARPEDTILPSGDTPAEPMPLTVDLPVPSPKPASDPFSLNDATRSGDLIIPPPATPDPLVRQSVPGYDIVGELGRGGMGVVYKARHLGLDRIVALKMILSGAHAGPAERERFRREAHAVAALQHPNIVQVYDVGEVNACPYLAFEFVEGGSLAARIGGQWNLRDAAALVETLARAAHFAHQRGIVHRDLKPANVLLTESSDSSVDHADNPIKVPSLLPKITDFGLAKRVEVDSDPSDTQRYDPSGPAHTRTGAVMGTPSYIAPEQAAGKNRTIGPAADVYALGAILYELVTGRPPFRGETPLDTVLQVMKDEAIPAGRIRAKLSKDLETICMKCLQKQPARRYATALDLAEDLRRFLEERPILARPIGYREKLIKWAKRHPTAATWSVFAIIGVLVLLGVSIYFNIELGEAAEREQNKARLAAAAQRGAEIQRTEAEKQKRAAELALDEVKKEREKAEAAHRETLKREKEVQRGAYALLLSQVAALAERDPRRGLELLTQTKRCPPELREFTWRYLRRVCDREMQVLLDHARGVSAVAYAPDGSLVASASWDHTIRIYDARTFQPRAVLEGHDGLVLSIAFSPDGSTLASAGDDRSIRLWDLPGSLRLPAQPGPPRVLEPWISTSAHAGSVRAVSFSADGTQLASGGEDGLIRVWNVPLLRRAVGMIGGGPLARFAPVGEARMRERHVLKGHAGGVWTVAFDSQTGENAELASGGEDRTVRIWKPGVSVDVLHTFQDPINCLDWSPDGITLAVATNSQDDPSIRLWDCVDRIEVARLRGHTQTVYSVAFGPDGKYVASGGQDNVVRIWDLETHSEKAVLRGHEASVRAIAFSPDRRVLATGGLDRALRFWSVTAVREETANLNSASTIEAASVSRDGKLLAVGEKSGLVKVWRLGPDLTPTGEAGVLKGHADFISALCFTQDAKTLATAGRDGTIRLWDMTKLFAPDPPAAQAETRRLNNQGLVRGLEFDPSGRFLIAGGESGLRLLDLRENKQRALPVMNGRARAVALSSDGKYFATATGTFVQIWNIETERVEMSKTLALGHTGEIVALAFDPAPAAGKANGWVLATADGTGMVILSNIAPADNPGPGEDLFNLERRAQLPGHGERIESFAFTRDGKTLATTSRDRTIKLWDPETGQERATFTGHSDAVVRAAFRPDDGALLTVGREGVAKVWQATRR